MAAIKFLGRAGVTGRIRLLSGLHIGAGKDTIEIGGIDNPVVKHPHSNDPYIPGSSIKGKLRFLLEWAFDRIRADGHPWGARDDHENAATEIGDPILRIFGCPIGKGVWTGGPTRVIVRDAMLSEAWRRDAIERGLALTEDKTEVVIDRIAGKAHDRVGPRQTERVPEGAQFDFELVFRAYDTGDGGQRDEDCLNWLLAGLSLLEQDALGGSGSRGYGRVRFENLVFRDLSGATRAIDNVFRIDRFDREKAPAIVSLGAA
jgi:CRISPR-associated protein Csm3